MEIKREKNRIWILVIGFICFASGLCLLTYHIATVGNINRLENDALNEFYDNPSDFGYAEDTILEEEKDIDAIDKIEYIAVLRIPKINLKRGLVNPNSYLNNVDYNVQILNDSTMPDIDGGNFILAAHSGNARVSYFKNLDKLSINDEVFIDYKDKTYKYKVVNIYDIDKTGTAHLIRNSNTSTLTLITCRHNTNRQIIIMCELV